jgi:hypothetical protein
MEKQELTECLIQKEADLDRLKEKLFKSKKLYEQISDQLTSLKRNIAVSRTRLHNRGDIETFNTRIEELLVGAKAAAEGASTESSGLSVEQRNAKAGDKDQTVRKSRTGNESSAPNSEFSKNVTCVEGGQELDKAGL